MSERIYAVANEGCSSTKVSILDLAAGRDELKSLLKSALSCGEINAESEFAVYELTRIGSVKVESTFTVDGMQL